MSTALVTLGRCHKTAWERFRAYHYEPDVWNGNVCRCYLAFIEGTCIGFCASIVHFGASGNDTRRLWRAHKTVCTLPISNPDYLRRWALISDAHAERHIKEGHRFQSVAPENHAAYRDASPLWRVTSGDREQKAKGRRSHEYVGLK